MVLILWIFFLVIESTKPAPFVSFGPVLVAHDEKQQQNSGLLAHSAPHRKEFRKTFC